MSVIAILIVAAVVLGVCWAVDKGFQKLFRNKAQHLSGTAIRANKRYGSFGIILIVLGVIASFTLVGMRFMGIIVILMGAVMVAHYLSFGIFYDEESFLVSGLGKKSRVYRHGDVRCQQLYAVTGGHVIIELRMKNGETVSVQSNMDGAYLFLDTAFAGWCRQNGVDPENYGFNHDPDQSCWFPNEEEV